MGDEHAMTTEPRLELDIRDLHISELDRYSDGIHDLLVRNIDALIVREALAAAEVNRLLVDFKNLPKEDCTDTGVTVAFPKPFGSVAFELRSKGGEERDVYLRRYFATCEEQRESRHRGLGADLEERFSAIFRRISGGRDVGVPAGLDGAGSYPGITTRRYLGERPTRGIIPLHCGNFFQEAFAPFYTHLTQAVRVKNQLSFLVMLGAPTEGGELTLFDFIWSEGQTMDGFGDNRHVRMPDGSMADLEDDNVSRRIGLRPGPGDLVLFQGGLVWHRVEAIPPDGTRVTAGGFMAPSHDDTKIYYWA